PGMLFSVCSSDVRYARHPTRSTAEQSARLLQMLYRIDPEDRILGERDVDAHSGLERAQLLKALLSLERRWRELHEALERAAPVGVKPDMVVERPGAGRRGRAGEIE